MTWDEFRRALILEQHAHPVPEWQPTAKHRIAAAERVRLIEDDLCDQEKLEQLRARKAEKAAARRARAEQWDALLAAAVDHPQGRGVRRRMLSRP